MGRQYTLGAQHHCSCSPASRHLASTSCPVLLPPTAQSCLPDLGVPPLPPAAHVHPPGMGREGRTAARPHLAPTAAPAAGLWPCLPLDCASFCHGPMASGMSVLWAQGAFVRAEPVGRGLWPSPASQAGAGENRSQGHLHGQKLPLAWPHSSQPGSAVSPLLQGLTGRKAPSPSSLPLQHQQPGGGSILHTPSAWGPAPTPAQSWHHLGEPQHPYQGMPWAQPARKGSRRAGGQENQAAAARFSFFQQLLSQHQQQGMCLGRGFQGPGHGVLNKLFIALTSLPGRNGQHSSCMGPGAWVPLVSSPPPPSQVPARWVRSPQRKDSWPPVISSPAISISSQCYAQSKICGKSCTPCGRDAQGPCPSSQNPCSLLNPLDP